MVQIRCFLTKLPAKCFFLNTAFNHTTLIERREIVLLKMFEKLTIDFANHAATTIILTSISTIWFISCTCHCFVFFSSIRQNWITPCYRNTLNFNFLEYIWREYIFLNMSPSCCIAISVFNYKVIMVGKPYIPFIFIAHVNWFQNLYQR